MRKSIVTYASIIVCVIVLFLSIGYSAFNSKLNITGTVATVRIKKDIRVTGISVYSRTNSGVSNYEDYNVSNIQMGVSLPNSSSTVTYKVTVTNIGNTEMGIFNITGLPNNLDYEITGYTLKTKICNTSNVCKLGITKDFYIKIKYKTFNSSTTSYGLVLNVDFQPMYTATYLDSSGVSHTSDVIGKDTYKLDFGSDRPTSVSVKMGGVTTNNYTYTNGVLTIPNVSGNIVITTEYGKNYLMVNPSVTSENTTFLGGEINRVTVESITFRNTKTVPSNVIGSWDVSEKQNGSIMAWYTDIDGNNKYELYIGQDGGVNANPDSSNLFQYFKAMKSINLRYLNTSDVDNMWKIFYFCWNLTELDLSYMDTRNVTNMGYMFGLCTGLTSLDLSPLNTSNVIDMADMFRSCEALTSLDVSTFDTSKVYDMQLMFAYCSGLTSLDLSSWNTSSLVDIRDMFWNCRSLKSLNVRNWNTIKVKSMLETFYNCLSLTTLDLSDWNTSNVNDMTKAFEYCSGLTSITFGSNFKTGNVTDMTETFFGCTNLRSLNLSSWDTSNVTKMYQTFGGCNSLTSLNLNGWNTSKVTTMANMFGTCSSLTNLNISSFTTTATTDMQWLFKGCTNLKTIDFRRAVFTNVTRYSDMFTDCTSLTTVYVKDSTAQSWINSRKSGVAVIA